MKRFFKFQQGLNILVLMLIFYGCHQNLSLEEKIESAQALNYVPCEPNTNIKTFNVKGEDGESIININFVPNTRKGKIVKDELGAFNIEVRDINTKKYHHYRCDFYHKISDKNLLSYHFYELGKTPYKLLRFLGKLEKGQFTCEPTLATNAFSIKETSLFNDFDMPTNIKSLKVKEMNTISEMDFAMEYNTDESITQIKHTINDYITELKEQKIVEKLSGDNKSPLKGIKPQYIQFLIRLLCQSNGKLYQHNPYLSLLPLLLFDRLPNESIEKRMDIEQKNKEGEIYNRFHLNTKLINQENGKPFEIHSELYFDFTKFTNQILSNKETLVGASLSQIPSNNVCCCGSKACADIIHERTCYSPNIFNYINSCYANGNIAYEYTKSLNPTTYYKCLPSKNPKRIQTTCPVAVCRPCSSSSEETTVESSYGLIQVFDCNITYHD